jgi:hypothetical protein
MFAAQGLLLALAAPLLLGPSIPPGEDARRPLAWRTLAVLTTAILAIAAADVASGAGPAILLLILGLALLIAAGAVNARPGERLLPPEAMRPATLVGAGYAMIFAMSAASAVFGVYGAAILQVLYGLSPLTAGYVVASDAVGWTLTALIVSGQPDRRHGGFIFAGASVIVAGMAILALFIASRQVALIVAGGFVLGAGFGMAWSLVTRRILMALPAEERAIGAAATPTAQMIGSAAGAAAAGGFANLLGLAHAFTPAMAATKSSWLFAAFVPLAGARTSWSGSSLRLSSQHPAERAGLGHRGGQICIAGIEGGDRAGRHAARRQLRGHVRQQRAPLTVRPAGQALADRAKDLGLPGRCVPLLRIQPCDLLAQGAGGAVIAGHGVDLGARRRPDHRDWRHGVGFLAHSLILPARMRCRTRPRHSWRPRGPCRRR